MCEYVCLCVCFYLVHTPVIVLSLSLFLSLSAHPLLTHSLAHDAQSDIHKRRKGASPYRDLHTSLLERNTPAVHNSQLISVLSGLDAKVDEEVRI
jgi:hypothetical protein